MGEEAYDMLGVGGIQDQKSAWVAVGRQMKCYCGYILGAKKGLGFARVERQFDGRDYNETV